MRTSLSRSSGVSVLIFCTTYEDSGTGEDTDMFVRIHRFMLLKRINGSKTFWSGGYVAAIVSVRGRLRSFRSVIATRGQNRTERERRRCGQNFWPARDSPVSRVVSAERRWHGRLFQLTAKRPWVGCSSYVETWCQSASLDSTVTVEPTAKVPLTFVLDVRLMVQVPVAVFRVICEAVNPITVPNSVLFPGKGTGLGLGIGP
jgi:hypothetical protein